MKITTVQIVLEPNEYEISSGRQTTVLFRTEDKMWDASVNSEVRGMYPHEIRLANDIQELIIQKFNGNQK